MEPLTAELLAKLDNAEPWPQRDRTAAAQKLAEAAPLLDRWAGEGRVLREAFDILLGAHQRDPDFAPAYAGLGLGPGSYPVAERLAGEVLSLPMYPELDDAHIERVCEVLTQAACVGG